MKMKFMALALGLISAVTTSQHVQASGQASGSNSSAGVPASLARSFGSSVAASYDSSLWRGGGAGPEVPFPLKEQVDFPWETIEGVWLAKAKGINALFSFRVQGDAQSNRILKVLHLDPETHRILAEGTGFTGSDDPRLVRAGMVTASGQSYWLIIGAYLDNANVKRTILTVRPFGGAEGSDIKVMVNKISSTPIDDNPTAFVTVLSSDL